MNINITRVDGAILIDPAPSYITSYLQYSHRSFGLQGYKRVNKFEKKELYTAAPESGIISFAGFFDKVSKLIESENDTLVVDDCRTFVKEPNLAAVRDINWDGIDSTGLRDYQIPLLVEFLYKAWAGNGICCAAGGAGKTILMACTYAAFQEIGPTIIAMPLKTIFDTTYLKFTKLFPNKHIGRVGGGFNDISNDITITTYKSLKNASLEKCKLLIMDEIQSTTGETTVSTLSSITPVRMLGFTATDKNLFNGADKLLKGLFGERLIYFPYADAEAAGAVVPCNVYMVRVPDSARFSGDSMDAKLIRGIKKNEVRNKLIGEICSSIPNNWQSLTFVDHIADHLIPLYNFMPSGTNYVHRGQGKEFGAFSLNVKTQDKNLNDFREGKYQHLIATDALKAGCDLPEIRVVIQASGGTSEVEILQEAYRGARTAPDKEGFFLIDFLDNHNETLENMAMKRMAIYEKQGWKVKIVNTPKEIDWSWNKEELKEL
jgi:superfamily II DNA or RNA helicase